MTRPIWAPWRLAYVQAAGEGDGCVFCAEASGKLGDESLLVTRGDHAFALLQQVSVRLPATWMVAPSDMWPS